MDKIKPLFAATATATGGRNGHTEASDGSVAANLSVPKEMGGSQQRPRLSISLPPARGPLFPFVFRAAALVGPRIFFQPHDCPTFR